jgi:hypothetical protein
MPFTRIRRDDLLSGSVGSGSLATGSITGLPAATSPDDSDLILIFDDNASALRKMSRANFTSGISATGNTFFTSPAAGKINTTGSAAFAGGELGSSYVATSIGADTFFFVSGTIKSRETSNTGSAVFGGDLIVSGVTHGLAGFSGSLTRLNDGTSYLNAGAGITIASSSAGQITITNDGTVGDITSVTAGTGLSGGGGTGDVTLTINDSVTATLSGSKFSGDVTLDGNLYVSGNVSDFTATGSAKFNSGISGSLTRLTDGTSYLAAGSNVTITSASNGQVSIAAATGITEVSEDTSPELGGQLVTADHKIAFGTGNNTSELDFTYNGGGNFTAIASVKSIDMFLDLNGGDSGQKFRIFNNLQPASSYAGGTNTDTNAIFMVREEGNVFTKGYITSSLGFSGSLTRLADGTSYLAAGTNVTISSESNGQVTISSSGGSGTAGAIFFNSTTAGAVFTTGSAAFVGGQSSPAAPDAPSDVGPDVFFFVSGTIGSIGTSSTGSAVFGGDVLVSGSLFADQGLSGSLTRLVDGTSYLAAGSNVTITSASNGQVTVASTDTNTEYTAGTGLILDSTEFSINDSVVATISGSNFTGNVGITGSLHVGSSATNVPTARALDVYANVSSDYAAHIDNDQSSSGHGLKVTSDGTGSGTILLDAESASTTHFRVRGDGRVGIGKVTSLPAAILTVSSSNDDGDIAIAHKLQHIGDDDTFIAFDNDDINLQAGGIDFIKITEDGSQDIIIFNDGSADVDFRVESNSNENMFFVEGQNNRVGIGTGAPFTTVHISGSASDETALTIQGQADVGIRLAADKANGDEGNNPYIDFYQDGQNPTSRNNRLAIIAMEGDAGTSFSDSIANAFFIDTFCPNATNAARQFQIATDTTKNGHSARITIGGVRGNVGLHTATPEEALHLSGAIRIDSQGRENTLVVSGTTGDDSHQMLVMSTTTDGYGDDTNFYVSGTIDSRGTSKKGTSVFGGDTVVSGNLHAAEYIYHLEDTDTSMRFESDQITFAAGGETLLTITEASQDIVTVGDGGDVDFKVRTNNNDNTLFVQGNTDRVGIGLNGPATTLHLKDSDVTIRLQRDDNSEASTIEFAGAGGAIGASIAHDVVGNDLVFDVFNGSTIEESLRLTGYASATNRQVIVLSGTTMHAGAMQPKESADIAFFVSGTIRSTNTAIKGAAVFGGDTVVSGAMFTHDIRVKKPSRAVLPSTGSVMSLTSSMNFFSVNATAEQSGITANTYDLGVTNGEYDGQEATLMYTGSLIPSSGSFQTWSSTSDYVKQVRVGYAGNPANIILAFSTATTSVINGKTLGLTDISGGVYSFTGSSSTAPGSPSYSAGDKTITYGVNGISSTDEAATGLSNGIQLAIANGALFAAPTTFGDGSGRISISQSQPGIAGNKAIFGSAITAGTIIDSGGSNAFTGGANSPNRANVNYSDAVAGGGVYINYKSPSLRMVWDNSKGMWNVITYNGVTI